MNRFILLFLILLFGEPLFAANNPPNVEENLDVRIQPICAGNNNWSGTGFLAVKVHLSNDTTHPGEWTYSVSGQGEISHVGNKITTPAKIRLNPGESVDSIIFIPPCRSNQQSYSYKRIFLAVEGTGIKGAVTQHMSITVSRNYTFLPSPDIDNQLLSELKDKYNNSSSPVEIKEWPADDRVYSCFSLVVLTKKYYDSLDQSYLNALGTWITKGGSLFIIDPAATADKNIVKQGLGTITTIGNTVKKTAAQVAESIRDAERQKSDKQISRPDSWRNYIPDHPAILISISLLAFAALVGPLSLFLWAPAGKRHRLFFLIPSFSLGFSALLILIIFFAEGFGGKGTRKAIVFLDPERNNAIILQSQVCKTAIITNTSFPLDEKTEFYSSKYTSTKKSSSDEWKDIMPNERVNGIASGGWFTSRSCISQSLKASQPTRARVSLVGTEEGCLAVQSTVPCELKEFIYISPDQTIWKAASLPPGQRVVLKKTQLKKKPNIPQGHFTAQGTKSQLAPIDTLPDITWESDNITYQGPVVNETTNR